MAIELQAGDLDRAGFQLHRLAVAGEIIGALALDLDGGIARRHLLDDAGKGRQQRANLVWAGATVAGLDHPALGVVGIPFLAPAHGEAVELAAVHDEGDGLGGFAERDRQTAGSERIERAGVSGALGLEQSLHHADRVGRGHADRLVENDPAMDVALVAFELLMATGSELAGSLLRKRGR